MTTQSAFESRIEDIIGLATPHFRRLGPEACEEAIQNTLALTWKFWLRLVEQGKAGDEQVFRSMVWYAVKHTKMGRIPQGRGAEKPKCVLDYARRRKNGVQVKPINLNSLIGRSASVPDAAAFQIDIPNFLVTLSERDQKIALDLASGMGTTEVAQRYKVTPPAISQFKTRFKLRYESFFAEG